MEKLPRLTQKEKEKLSADFTKMASLLEGVYDAIKDKRWRKLSKKKLMELTERLSEFWDFYMESVDFILEHDHSEPPLNLFAGLRHHTIAHGQIESPKLAMKLIIEDGFENDHLFPVNHYEKKAKAMKEDLIHIIENKNLRKTVEDIFKDYPRTLGEKVFEKINEYQKVFYELKQKLKGDLRKKMNAFRICLVDNAFFRNAYFVLDCTGPRYLHYNTILCKTFNKILIKGFKPELFNVKDILKDVLDDRKVLAHHERFKLRTYIRSYRVRYDPDVLDWQATRMLSNAERATSMVKSPKISLTTKAENGNVYIIVKDNGLGVEAMADLTKGRGGGQSMPNIKVACKHLSGSYSVEDKPDGGVIATLAIPRAKVSA